jgi:putative DNA primase/helicase
VTGDEYFHSRHFVPDGAALPGEPVVEGDAPESRQQRRQRERQDAKAQRQRGNGIYEPNRLQPPDAPPDPPPPTKAPPIEVNPHDEPDAEKFAREKANGGSHPTGSPPNGAHYGKRGVDLADKRKPEKQPTVELVSAAAIEPEPVDWLWDGWFAKGKLQVIAGIPGTGKTTLALAFGAITSIGGVWPDGSQATSGNVVIWSGEDDPKDTLVPRLIAAGADRSRIHFVKSVSENGEKRSFDPAKDMASLSRAVEQIGDVKLIIIDPIAMVAVKDSHRNAETRRDLQPVKDLCEATGAAGLGIHHLAKGSVGREPQERLVGSVAFSAVARVVMIATKMPLREGEKNERRVLIRAKSNVGPDEGGYVYSLEQTELSGYPIFASCVLWGEAIEGTAREVLAEAELETERAPRDEAKDFLLTLLGEGPVDAKAVFAAARGAGISTNTLKRAKADLKVKSVRTGFGKDASFQWELSGNPTTSPSIETHISIETHSQKVGPYEAGGSLWEAESGETGKTSGLEEVEF